MIVNFKCTETEKIFNGESSKRLPLTMQKVARRKLRMINNAITLTDLRITPANRLEKLIGNRKGQYSIRINDQWRICFIWKRGQVEQVEIADYH